jgi:L-fucose isomerase-like protein
MNPAQDLRLGLVALARTTFDIPLANQVAAQVRLQLHNAGFQLAGIEALVTNLEETRAVARQLAQQPLDLLVVLQATFADSTMVMGLAEMVGTPLLLWAVPEERSGGRLRLNSFCGINLGAHALRRGGYGHNYVYAPPHDPMAREKIHVLAVAGRACRLLRQARLGRVGENPDGLDSCKLDRGALARHFGLDVVQVHLADVLEAAKNADSKQVDTLEQDLIRKLAGLQELDRAAVRRTLGSYVALRQLAEEQCLAGLAVRCWPEFFTELGCAACGAMSMLSDELIPCSCEADINGTVTQLMLQWISGEAAFGTDVVSFELDEDLAVVWHCGLAPLSMADPAVHPRATIHSNRKLPLLMEFPLKPGRVTVARLSEATGHYRLVVGGGEMIAAPMSFTGTSGVLRFDRPAAEILDTMLGEGLEHHLSLTYGDHVPALLALGRMLDLPVLRLS